MGGKNKQRTKGNVRPSSSGRMAELMSRVSSGESGFVGFGAMSGDLGYVPAAQGTDDIDASVDPEFRMVLRKLSKRDVTTKLKAIQEFGSLCKERGEEAVKGALPYWPRLYNRIAVDHDRRVREASQVAFQQLVLKVGRSLAPHLKHLMGIWLLSQCDTYVPSADAARLAFSSAFPQNKQAEALVFCKHEVLTHLQDNLFKQTPQTMSDPKTTSPEEVEAKYQRVVTASLMAIKLFMNIIPASENMDLTDTYARLLGNDKLWKFSKHKSPQIRGALYSVIAAFCVHAPEVARREAPRVCPSVLGNLDDSDPAVCPHLWEAVLHVISTIEDCWQHVNPRKSVLPKLWIVLRTAGKGSGTAIFPNILPLLSKIPADIIGTGIGFYQEFFNNLKMGLSSEHVQYNSRERGAVVSAFMECLRYCLVNNTGDDGEKLVIQNHLVLDQLMPVVEASLVEHKSRLSTSPLHPMVADLISYMDKRSQPDSDTHHTYQRLLTLLWRNLGPVCSAQLKMEGDSKTVHQVLNNVASLLECIRTPSTKHKLAKRTSRVTFSISDDHAHHGARLKTSPLHRPSSGESSGTESERTSVSTNDPEAALKDGPMLELVCSLSKSALKITKEENSLPHLTFLARMVKAFPCRHIFTELFKMDSKDGKEEDSQEEVVQEFFSVVLLPWLQKEDAVVATETEMSGQTMEHLVTILFALVECCEGQEQKFKLVDTVIQECNGIQAVQWIVQKGVAVSDSHPMHKWLRSETLGSRLLSLAQQLCSDSFRQQGEQHETADSEDSWDLLSLCLSTGDDNESLLAPEYQEKILQTFQQALPRDGHQLSEDPAQLHKCVGFICDVANSFFSSVPGCLLVPSSEDLLLTLFQIGASGQHKWKGTSSFTYNDPVKTKLHETWCSGVQALIADRGGLLNEEGFFCKAARWIKQSLTQNQGHLEHVQSLASASLSLVTTMVAALAEVDTGLEGEGGAPPGLNPTVVEFVRLLVPSKEEWETLREAVSQQWSQARMLDASLYFSTIPDPPQLGNDPAAVPDLLPVAIFVGRLLGNLQRGNIFAMSCFSNKVLFSTGSSFSESEDFRDSRCSESSERVSECSDESRNSLSLDLKEFHLSDHMTSISEFHASPRTSRMSSGESSARSDDKAFAASLRDGLGGELYLDVVLEVVYVWEWCNAATGKGHTGYQGVLHQPHRGSPLLMGLELLYYALLPLLSKVQHEDWEQLLSRAAKRSLEQGGLWSLSFGYLYNRYRRHSKRKQQKTDVLQLCGGLDRFSELDQASLHTLQTIVPLLTQEDTTLVLEVHAAKVLSCQREDINKVSGGVGALAVLSKCFGHSSSLSSSWEVLMSVLNELAAWREGEEDIFLFNCHIGESPADQVTTNIEAMQFLGSLVEKAGVNFTQENWDFVLCSLVAFLQSCSESLGEDDVSFLTTAFAMESFNLLSTVADFLASHRGKKGKELPGNLFTEWNEFFSEGAYSVVLPMFMKLADTSKDQLKSPPLPSRRLLEATCAAVVHVPEDVLQAHPLEARLVAGQPSQLPDRLQTLLNHLCPMLLVENRALQLAAFKLLLRLMPSLASYDEGLITEGEKEEKEEVTLSPPAALLDVLEMTSTYVEVILAEVTAGECAVIQPGSEAHHFTMAYLLAWKLLLTFFRGANSELRAAYSSHLRESKSVQLLLLNLFRLMPSKPILMVERQRHESGKGSPSRQHAKSHQPKSMFEKEPGLDVKGEPSSPEMQHLACMVYYNTLEDLPAMVRQWWNSQDKRVSTLVERLTSKFVSPVLCAAEIQAVQSTQHSFDNMTVKGRPAAREVVATYTVDEVSMELVVQLPVNHPLGTVNVESGKRVGVASAQWRNWMLQMTTFLSHQNGSIMDGLILWKKNVDKRFEGVEDCMVCYSVIHGSNCQLPKLSCKTCKKKFHSACLYKWFSTSNQSTCPLCRNLW
ncbi:E3 ubiquitin-protein ligase listerin-like isoform X3 [Branchiostoma lanceolatum]|uniref:E3 ubiquitin-protein ligase listerin-like isoform X3 n=1 Tax=Branchiostoma lanceolatum TaxID=7740 RepID=UPI003455BF61